MAKKSRQNSAGPKTSEEVLGLDSPSDVFYALEGVVKCRDSSDYRQMPELGKLITALFQINMVANAEGIFHYVLHSSDRLHDARSFLGAIGATKKAEVLKKIEDFFPGGKIPDSESERWEALMGADDGGSGFVDNVVREWREAGEDIPALIKAYFEDHRSELDGLIADRSVKIASSSTKYVPMNDEEIIRRAYANEENPFMGHEFDLVDFNRLPVLMRLVNDSSCPARQWLFDALYGISASMASEILAGKMSADLGKLQGAISESMGSVDEQIREWAHRSDALLAKPDPVLIMEWMGSAVKLH